MKKFLACIFILAVFAAVVFYLGWTQFKVKPDSVGVLISKTGGVSEEPVVNGKFSWYWECLLPTNSELKTFSIAPVNVNKVVRGQLPSGEIYSAIYNSSDTFSYFFDFAVSVTISPEQVVELLRLNKISDNDDLQEYLNKAAETLAQLSADYYLKKAAESSSFRPESVRREDILRNVMLYKDCPEVDVTVFALCESKIPDFELYKKLQSEFLRGSIGQELPIVLSDDVADTDAINENIE